MKKRIVLIAVIIMAIVAITMIYQTFATNSGTTSYNVYDITLSSIEEITVPARTSKTYYYQITNTNKGVVQYGVVYSGNNITVKVFDDSDDLVSGTIDYGENKFVKLYVENTGTSDSTASIKTVLGYEKGGSLEDSNVVPEEHEFVTDVYTFIPRGNMIEYITNLYLKNNPTIITHYQKDGTTEVAKYYYSYMDKGKTWGIMNDGLDNVGNRTDDIKTEGNIRYYGSNPNNYIYFNCNDYNNQNSSTCEKWRVIGIVDGKVKIIREGAIGTYSWDYTPTGENDNNWHDATLMTILNDGYYNNKDGVNSYWSFTDFEDKTTIKKDINNFNTDGIGIKNEKTQNMISESVWYLGGHSSAGIYPNQIYKYERGTAKCSNCTYETTWIGKIGLIYPSDYGYASNLSICFDKLDNYNNCFSTNWLMNYNGYSKYFITPRTFNDNYVFSYSGLDESVGANGYVVMYDSILYGEPYYYNEVYPTLYLDPELILKDNGNGTINNPYQIDVS